MIYNRIVIALDHNEHEWHSRTKIAYKGKCYAEGLERLLYVCPKCHQEFTLSTKDDDIICSACGNTITYAHTGELIPVGEDSKSFERIDYWYDFERKLVADEVKKDDFYIEDKVKLFIENETRNGYRFIVEGTLSLDKTYLRFVANSDIRLKDVKPEFRVNNMDYEATRDECERVEDEFKELNFNISKCDTIANQPGTAVDMYDEKHTYRFMFTERFASTKYTLAVEEMFKNR